MFSHTKYHFSWISLFFLSGIVNFYCGTWGNMKRCLFLLVFAANFNVSMKRHMLIVSLFFARCCFNFISLLQHVLFQMFFSCFPTRNSTCHDSFSFFFQRKSTVFTAARGVIWRAWVLNMTLTCPTPPHPTHQRTMNMTLTCPTPPHQRTMNMTLTCPTPPHPSTYHEHDVNMPHPTPPINVPWTWR